MNTLNILGKNERFAYDAIHNAVCMQCFFFSLFQLSRHFAVVVWNEAGIWRNVVGLYSSIPTASIHLIPSEFIGKQHNVCYVALGWLLYWLAGILVEYH